MEGIEAEYIIPGYEHIGHPSTRHRLNEEVWRYRSPLSAGTSKALACGIISRLHNAARLSHPKRPAKRAVLKLMAVCLYLKYPMEMIKSMIAVTRRKYPHILGRDLCDALTRSLSRDPGETIFKFALSLIRVV